MSVSSEVQRTLVKSPPELWAELSDPSTLARHLGELGEIRIVRTEPDRAVDWEAAAADGAQATGRVEIAPSGWGTRVKLSASRTVVVPEPGAQPEPEAVESDPEPVSAAEPEPVSTAEPEPVSTIQPAPQPEPEAFEAPPEAGPEPEPEAIGAVPAIETAAEDAIEAPLEVEPEPEAEVAEVVEADEPKSHPGFFARLFRRRRHRPDSEAMVEPKQERIAEPESESAPEPTTEPNPEPIAAEIEAPSPPKPAPENTVPSEPASIAPVAEPDISVELAELEAQTTAVLTGVLDRLGAAHHRPFSRS